MSRRTTKKFSTHFTMKQFLTAFCLSVSVLFLAIGCAKDDKNSSVESRRGEIFMTQADYNDSNTSYMFSDDEEDAVLYNSQERSFYVNAPLQITVTSDLELRMRFYCGRAIDGVIVWAQIPGYDEQFRLARFEKVLPFQEFKQQIPFTLDDKLYYTRSGKMIEIMKNDHVSPSDIKLEIECESPLYKQLTSVKPKWFISFGDYHTSGNPNWGKLKPVHARESVCFMLNIAEAFSTPEFEAALRSAEGQLNDNGRVISTDEILSRTFSHGSFLMGLISGNTAVAGLGGGSTYGILEENYLQAYVDDTSVSDIPFHEFAHCLGYSHNGNMTYYGSTGYPPICIKVFNELGKAKRLPIYSRRFLGTRVNKHDQLNKAAKYVPSWYIIEDPELDAIDGGLNPAPQGQTDLAGKEGKPLNFTIGWQDLPNASKATFTPKDICLYGNTLYVVNDAANNNSLEVFDLSNGVKHVKTIRSWNGGPVTSFNRVTGVTRANGRVYVTTMDSRTLVFDAETYQYMTCIGNGNWGENPGQTVHAFDVEVAHGIVFIRDKRKLVFCIENDMVAGQTPYVYGRSANLVEYQFNAAGVDFDREGKVYTTHQQQNKIDVFKIEDLRMRNDNAPLYTIKLNGSPLDVAFHENRMFVSFTGGKLYEINPETGAVIKDLSGDYTKGIEKMTSARGTLVFINRNDGTIRAMDINNL